MEKLFELPHPNIWYLSHPIIFGKDMWRYIIKPAYHRLIRGWDNQAAWNLDWYLAELIPEVLKKQMNDGIGYPATNLVPTTHKWDEIRQEIINGFKAANTICSEEYKCWDEFHEKLKQIGDTSDNWHNLYDEMNMGKRIREETNEYMVKFHRGMILLHQHFFELWD